ncbi:CKLF-like MARVEL transmembrane domain-containing protein 6 [Electrophorus electricus]|uniref:MARVEL domain-containing protein n=1 Tax=Electrophorus electricus TaxID=8005 RepID=A0A4W4F907_ELEEL|nr:CKLF-like MARVEL transmembrane domain-containing protein 6 [Electrophorus electricus]
MATTDPVYNTTTTTTQDAKSRKWFVVPSAHLDKIRFFIKVLEVLLSLVAFTLEELVTSCTSCTALYFFEFVSCTAFLFTFLLLTLLATTLHQRVGISCWPQLDCGYTALIMAFFLISSITFAAQNGETNKEKAAVAFGFLASGAFLVDVAVFVQTKGFPCWTRNALPTDVPTSPVPESVKLNVNGAD